MNLIDREFYRRDIVPVVANIKADFFPPIFHGDEIEMQTRISRLGSKSITFHQQAVNINTQQVLCECYTVVVTYSLSQQAPVEIPTWMREKIEDFEGVKF
jgi:acyl-CoA thioester hydrolase